MKLKEMKWRESEEKTHNPLQRNLNLFNGAAALPQPFHPFNFIKTKKKDFLLLIPLNFMK